MADDSIRGLEELLKNMDKVEEDLRREAMNGLKAAGMNIIVDAQDNLLKDHINNMGTLSQSGKTQKIDDEHIEVGFIADNGQGYAEFVEYGRRSGRMPPPDVMGEWAYHKLRIRERKIADKVGWGLAVNIAKKGTKPHPFFKPAVDKNQSKIKGVIQDAIDKIL